MCSVRHRLLLSAVSLLFVSNGVSASAISDFEARLTQTSWSLQHMEGLLRAQPHSAVPLATPEALVSFMTLLSENATALTGHASNRGTDEQRRIMAEGLKAVATTTKDIASLATNRGLTALASALGALETSCRSAIVQLSSREVVGSP